MMNLLKRICALLLCACVSSVAFAQEAPCIVTIQNWETGRFLAASGESVVTTPTTTPVIVVVTARMTFGNEFISVSVAFDNGRYLQIMPTIATVKQAPTRWSLSFQPFFFGAAVAIFSDGMYLSDSANGLGVTGELSKSAVWKIRGDNCNG